MTYDFSPETKRLYDELLYVLRTSLADGDADDAIGCLDALLTTHREDNLTEGAGLIQAQRAAVYADAGRHTADGMDRARDLLLAACATTALEG